MKLSVGGVVSTVIILVSSIIVYFTVGVWCVVCLTTLKFVFGESTARRFLPMHNRFHDFLMLHWIGLVAMTLEIVQGTKVAYTVADGAGQPHLDESRAAARYADGSKRPRLYDVLSPPSAPGKVKFVIANHHCRVDWIYFFLYCARSAMTPTLRIVLKEDLSKLPLFGAIMEDFRFLFLSRSWQSDEAYLKCMVDYFNRTHESVTILIFPEGTDLSESNVGRSQAYAKEHNLPIFNRVLNPRTTGLVALKDMFGTENVEEIVDCTLAYTYAVPGKRPAELSLVDGTQPRKVHMLVRRYRVEGTTSPNAESLMNTVPGTDNEKLKQWVNDRFAEKEQLLSRFYANNPVGFDEHDVRAVYGEHCGVLTYDEDTDAAKTIGGKSKLAAFISEVGWQSFAANVFMWVGIPLYCFGRYHALLLLLYLAVALFAYVKARARLNLTQRSLLLDAIPEERSLWWRLSRSSKAPRKVD